jgi:hypothetical protein
LVCVDATHDELRPRFGEHSPATSAAAASPLPMRRRRGRCPDAPAATAAAAAPSPARAGGAAHPGRPLCCASPPASSAPVRAPVPPRPATTASPGCGCHRVLSRLTRVGSTAAAAVLAVARRPLLLVSPTLLRTHRPHRPAAEPRSQGAPAMPHAARAGGPREASACRRRWCRRGGAPQRGGRVPRRGAPVCAASGYGRRPRPHPRRPPYHCTAAGSRARSGAAAARCTGRAGWAWAQAASQGGRCSGATAGAPPRRRRRRRPRPRSPWRWPGARGARGQGSAAGCARRLAGSAGQAAERWQWQRRPPRP